MQRSNLSVRTHAHATQILLEACVQHPIERLVYASSSSVYGDEVTLPMHEDARPQPVSPYGVTKLSAEQLCHLYYVNYRVPAVSLRYFTVYGPRQRPDMGFHRFFKAVMAGTPIASTMSVPSVMSRTTAAVDLSPISDHATQFDARSAFSGGTQ